MSRIIDFYFDYSSPYGYLASERIEAIAEANNYRVVWRPILLGAIFKVTGQAPLIEAPLKGDYAVMDFARSAREHKLDYQHPQTFPVGAVAACRATLWIRDHKDESIRLQTSEFVHATFRAYYTQGKDITNPPTLSANATALGIKADDILEGIQQAEVKNALRTEVEKAIAAGVFGSPMMIVDGQAFWGHDRIEQLGRWLETGGW